jgi:hypothetical protein
MVEAPGIEPSRSVSAKTEPRRMVDRQQLDILSNWSSRCVPPCFYEIRPWLLSHVKEASMGCGRDGGVEAGAFRSN